jgi:endonuclease-3 related protein
LQPTNPDSRQSELQGYYRTLFEAWGRQHWWPAGTRFEVIVGAYLTQNTLWTNVERALRRLRTAGLLTIRGIRETQVPKLEALIRSAGYFRQKARRLKTFVAFLDKKYGGSLDRLFAQPTEKIRRELLDLNGVGPETADSILLYAGNHPTFVVDTYTRRILVRHNIVGENATYDEIRGLWERALAPLATKNATVPQPETRNRKLETISPGHPPSRMSTTKRSGLVQVYNEMHGLIVSVGKNFCLKSRPMCDQCPLQKFLPSGQQSGVSRQ